MWRKLRNNKDLKAYGKAVVLGHVLSNFEENRRANSTSVIEAGLRRDRRSVGATEEVIEVRLEKSRPATLMPGYVLVRRDVWSGYHRSFHDRVTGFLGPQAAQCRCAMQK